MKNKMTRPLSWLPVLLISTSVAACSDASKETTPTVQPASNEAASNTTSSTASASGSSTIQVTYDKEDMYSDWTKEKPSYIKLNGSTASLEGTGAAIDGSTIMILLPGVYVLSGTLDDGQILVDSQKGGTVKLVLNGVELNNSNNAPIFVKNADKTILSLPEGTSNTVSDGKTYVYANPDDDEPNAAIFSKDDLVLNGSGSLTVYGNYNNGIMGKDDVKITGGNITIYSVDDGLAGRDLLAIKDGIFHIEAEGDGIRSTNDKDAGKGNISLSGGVYTIRAGADGIQAVGTLSIAGGEYDVVTGGGSANAAAKAGDSRQGPGGFAPAAGNAASTTASTAAEKQSAKGLKAGTDITVTDGVFAIDSSDDALHSNGSLTISGGSFAVISGDDGIHADASILIQDGVINITKSYEGIESKNITLAGGEIHVTASDDGINISGGNDGSSVNGRPGQNAFSASGDSLLQITGGFITVNAAGDGLDSNGSIMMSGGTVLVSGPTDNGNGALDYDGSFSLTGGVLMAAGSAGMAQAPSEQSEQNSVMMTFTSQQKAGTSVTLQDSKGRIVAAFTPGKNFQTIVMASPDLKKDEEYTLYTGGTFSGNVQNGLVTEGSLDGGTKVVSFSIASSVTYLNEAGVTTGSRGGMGGGQPGRSQGQAQGQGGLGRN